jgi:putative sterol carrier protein
MSLDELKEALQKRLGAAPALGYTVTLDFGDDGALHLDGTQGSNQLVNGLSGEPDTTLTLAPETMKKIIDGDTDPNMAVLMGKLKVGGKMGVALKLAGYLEG